MNNLHPSIKEGLAIFECLRKLGFEPNQIYAGAKVSLLCEGSNRTSQKMQLVIIVLKAGSKEFVIQAGPWEETQEAFNDAWIDAAEKWNSSTKRFRDDIWNNSLVATQATPLIAALASKGIHLPCVIN